MDRRRMPTNLKVLIVVVLFTALAAAIYLAFGLTNKDIVLAAFSAALSGALVSGIFALISRIQAQDEISKGLSSLLTGQSDVLQHFTPKARSKVVETALASNFGKGFGEAIHRNLLARLFDGTSDVYSLYEYTIDIFDMSSARELDSSNQKRFIDSLREDAFIWTRTKFKCKLELSKLERHLSNKNVMIAICFSSNALKGLSDATSVSREKKFVQREVLFLNSNEIQDLSESDYANPRNFATEVLNIKCMQFRQSSTGQDREIFYDPRWSEVVGERYLEVEFHLTWDELEIHASEFEMSFPSRKDERLFFALLPRPARNPFIRFNNHLSDLTRHQEITSASRSDVVDVDTQPHDGARSSVTIKVQEWVFPTSGVVFYWQ